MAIFIPPQPSHHKPVLVQLPRSHKASSAMIRDWSPWGLTLPLWDISHLKLKYFDKTIFCYWQLAWLQRKIFRNKSKILNLILNLRWEGKGRNKNHDILIVAQEVWKESSDQVKRSGQGTAEYQSAISPGYLYILMWWRGHKYLPGAEWWVVTLGKVSTAENNDEYNDVAAILLF